MLGLWLIEAGSARTRRELLTRFRHLLHDSALPVTCWITAVLFGLANLVLKSLGVKCRFRAAQSPMFKADCLSYRLYGLLLRVKMFIE